MFRHSVVVSSVEFSGWARGQMSFANIGSSVETASCRLSLKKYQYILDMYIHIVHLWLIPLHVSPIIYPWYDLVVLNQVVYSSLFSGYFVTGLSDAPVSGRRASRALRDFLYHYSWDTLTSGVNWGLLPGTTSITSSEIHFPGIPRFPWSVPVGPFSWAHGPSRNYYARRGDSGRPRRALASVFQKLVLQLDTLQCTEVENP